MRTIAWTAGIIMILAISACNEEAANRPSEDLIIGNWSHIEYQDSIITLERVSKLPEDEYGISFHEKGELTEWKNSGWCGTPPISYGQFTGNWELKNDSVVSIEAEYWGGTMIMEWKIVHIDQQQLRHIVVSSDY